MRYRNGNARKHDAEHSNGSDNNHELEFPKIRGPNTDTKILGSLRYKDIHRKGPQFMELPNEIVAATEADEVAEGIAKAKPCQAAARAVGEA